MQRTSSAVWQGALAIIVAADFAAAGRARPLSGQTDLVRVITALLVAPTLSPVFLTIGIFAVVISGIGLCFSIERNESVRLAWIAVLAIGWLIVAENILANIFAVAAA
jgi:hypothetical protein